MTTLWILLGCTAIVAVLGLVEAFRLRQNRKRTSIRIHVNGTRGKSSVTRLIAAGLREGGIPTLAKTTGTLPRLILPDGSEMPINRNGRANVIEQRDVAQVAAKMGVDALVVECMALQPRYQSLCELQLVRATHGVITNCRADHLDVMGPTERDVACALANTTPVRGKLFTAEQRHLEILQQASDDRRTQLLPTTAVDVAKVTDLEMAGFRFDEHRENVALALRVCQEIGVDRAAALRGMQEAEPDPGATTTHQIEFHGREILFVNAFAANEPASTAGAWQRASDARPTAAKRIAVMNCRWDRPDRSQQFAAALADWSSVDHVILVGSGTRAFMRTARRAGWDMTRLVVSERASAAELFEQVIGLVDSTAIVVGMGNIGEGGLEIASYFRNRSQIAPLPSLQSPELATTKLDRPEPVARNRARTRRRKAAVKKLNGHALVEHTPINGTTIAGKWFSSNGHSKSMNGNRANGNNNGENGEPTK